MTENEMVGWHHRLNGHEFEQTLGDGEGQGKNQHAAVHGVTELDTTERLNKNNNNSHFFIVLLLSFITLSCIYAT